MEPIKMMCEFEHCKSINVRDYKRKKQDQEAGWEDEPIALCPEHCGDREPMPVNPFLNLPKNSNQ